LPFAVPPLVSVLTSPSEMAIPSGVNASGKSILVYLVLYLFSKSSLDDKEDFKPINVFLENS